VTSSVAIFLPTIIKNLERFELTSNSHPEHAIASFTQTASPMFLPGEYKRSIPLSAKLLGGLVAEW